MNRMHTMMATTNNPTEHSKYCRRRDVINFRSIPAPVLDALSSQFSIHLQVFSNLSRDFKIHLTKLGVAKSSFTAYFPVTHIAFNITIVSRDSIILSCKLAALAAISAYHCFWTCLMAEIGKLAQRVPRNL